MVPSTVHGIRDGNIWVEGTEGYPDQFHPYIQEIPPRGTIGGIGILWARYVLIGPIGCLLLNVGFITLDLAYPS